MGTAIPVPTNAGAWDRILCCPFSALSPHPMPTLCASPPSNLPQPFTLLQIDPSFLSTLLGEMAVFAQHILPTPGRPSCCPLVSRGRDSNHLPTLQRHHQQHYIEYLVFCISSESLWCRAWAQTTSRRWDEEGGQEETSPPISGVESS